MAIYPNGNSSTAPPHPSTTSILAEAALGYAEEGFRVLPLQPGGKRPLGRLVPQGVKDASSDPGKIRDWWKREPTANVGLACGGGLTVLDVDPRNGGDETLSALEKSFGPLATRMVRTGSGGRHFYFRDDDESPIKPGTNRCGPGLDIKGSGGYVVAPPSVHPNGTPYTLSDQSDMAPVPSWLRGVAARNRGAKRQDGTDTLRWATLRAPGATPDERIRWTAEVVRHIPNSGRVDERDPWVGMAHAIRASCGEGAEADAFEIFDNFCQTWEGGEYDPDETQRVWTTLPASTNPGGYPRLLSLAVGYDLPPDHPFAQQGPAGEDGGERELFESLVQCLKQELDVGQLAVVVRRAREIAE